MAGWRPWRWTWVSGAGKREFNGHLQTNAHAGGEGGSAQGGGGRADGTGAVSSRQGMCIGAGRGVCRHLLVFRGRGRDLSKAVEAKQVAQRKCASSGWVLFTALKAGWLARAECLQTEVACAFVFGGPLLSPCNGLCQVPWPKGGKETWPRGARRLGHSTREYSPGAAAAASAMGWCYCRRGRGCAAQVVFEKMWTEKTLLAYDVGCQRVRPKGLKKMWAE